MRRVFKSVLGLVLVIVVLLMGGLVYVKRTGLRAQPTPGAVETRVARALRGLAIPASSKTRQNPLPASPEALSAGLEHFARYCLTSFDAMHPEVGTHPKGQV